MHRLFVYGSLRPGAANEHVLAGIDGRWEPGVIRGRLVDSGWGADLGYPALVLDRCANEVEGLVLTSAGLASRWRELDAFEGEEYERVVAPVQLENGEEVEAHVYVFRPQ